MYTTLLIQLVYMQCGDPVSLYDVENPKPVKKKKNAMRVSMLNTSTQHAFPVLVPMEKKIRYVCIFNNTDGALLHRVLMSCIE